jgi:hypothetical protein
MNTESDWRSPNEFLPHSTNHHWSRRRGLGRLMVSHLRIFNRSRPRLLRLFRLTHTQHDTTMHDTTQQLREALENAEFLLRKLAVNPKEAVAMADSCRNAAELARQALDR